MTINVKLADPSQRRKKPTDESKLGFGIYFSDHMFLMNYNQSKGWHDPRIEPYAPISLEPSALVLHYSQQVFEGMKAYRRADGGIQLFRPQKNFERINNSAKRLCTPPIDASVWLQALKELIKVDRDWVPHTKGASLYIRPIVIGTQPFVGVKTSSTYLFYIFTSPVGAYYAEGFNPTRILVADHYVRAVKGGVGEAKTAGPYAASLLAAEEAHEKGFTQVLWLDAIHHNYVEEVGTSNIFFLIGDELITPPLTGSILPGVTRDSVIQLARGWNLTVQERPISIVEVVEAAHSGRLKEIFATGTAAVISPVGEIGYKDETYLVSNGEVGDLSKRLYDELTGIQYGERPDRHGWIEPVT
jgi:branched-chain amino acid aminotransferase